MSENGVEKVIIIGSGPAGWTAALYASRADLDPLVFEGAPSQQMIPGGQLMFTTDVENYPGYPDGVTGQDMMADFKKQATRFGARGSAIGSAAGSGGDSSSSPSTPATSGVPIGASGARTSTGAGTSGRAGASSETGGAGRSSETTRSAMAPTTLRPQAEISAASSPTSSSVLPSISSPPSGCRRHAVSAVRHIHAGRGARNIADASEHHRYRPGGDDRILEIVMAHADALQRKIVDVEERRQIPCIEEQRPFEKRRQQAPIDRVKRCCEQQRGREHRPVIGCRDVSRADRHHMGPQ